MTWQLFFTEQYNKRAAKFSKLHHDVETQYAKTLELLELNPHHPSLRLYGLPEKLDGLQSIVIKLKISHRHRNDHHRNRNCFNQCW
ncbi:hypothetical protein LHV13_04215 [Ferrovum sp. PN-J185]|uniref:hypothetical protein n=1 Tax=Ferrovum sp. PN-J185 TaxID=1356306 RepID=UPI000797E2E5|nr:hypothetical protein [Ferrovum sp. PN-J185]KXW56440.1 hypothetical protein FV185_03890 [Ferrovum sp. PN-J185]MCC6068381.1 hypothetical protein [Ferrovum sp. PN-J185]